MFFLVSKFSYIRFEGDKRSLKGEISGSWILYRMGYNGFYSIFVYTWGAGRILLSCCKARAFGRVFVAASMDRNYRGPISRSQRARSASGSIDRRRMFFFVTRQTSQTSRHLDVLFITRALRITKATFWPPYVVCLIYTVYV
jgi:hypothetical protein